VEERVSETLKNSSQLKYQSPYQDDKGFLLKLKISPILYEWVGCVASVMENMMRKPRFSTVVVVPI